MHRIDTFGLRKAISGEEFDFTLLSSALSHYAAPRQKISTLMKSGVITRVKKGLYVFAPQYNQAPVCKEVIANLIYGPSCISLEYALAYHGLIPERVETLTSVTPKRDKGFDTPIGRFTYRYLAMEKYPHGIKQIQIDENHSVLMASPEKALCDYVALSEIPPLSGIEEAGKFLTADLRIDRKLWPRLDKEALNLLNRYYRDKNIACIAEAL
ncbi:MAG: hypothetical protein AABZ44_00430 [Elusimicrobiota bacterium]